MRAPDDEQELALRLAEALATYADPVENPAPRLLAARAIEQVRVVCRRWWWSGAGLVSAMACLLVLAFVASLHREPARLSIEVSPHANPARRPQLAQVYRTPLAATLTHSVKRVATRAKPAELPRLSQFPTPQPLTEQEKLMLAFVSSATPAAQQLVARAVEPPVTLFHVEQYAILRDAESHLSSGGSSALESTSQKNTGAPHEERR